jgi:hypothetical protein
MKHEVKKVTEDLMHEAKDMAKMDHMVDPPLMVVNKLEHEGFSKPKNDHKPKKPKNDHDEFSTDFLLTGGNSRRH